MHRSNQKRICIFSVIACIVLHMGCNLYNRELQEQSPHSLECGGVQIAPVKQEFPAGLDVDYVVTSDAGMFCVPKVNDYYEDHPKFRAVRLVKAGGSIPDSKILPGRVLFGRARNWREETNPFKSPYLLDVASGGPVLWAIEPGEYRLELKYLLLDCVGKMRAEVCLAWSEPFIVKNRQEYVIER